MTAVLRRLRELEQKATPGPWWPSAAAYSHLIYADDPQGRRTVCHPPMARDAELILAMHHALPALLDVAEAAEDPKLGQWTPEGEAATRRLVQALARLEAE